MRAPRFTDYEALNRIQELMNGVRWDSDTASVIAHIIRQTGRVIEDVVEEESSCH
jgi:hypothetical protein